MGGHQFHPINLIGQADASDYRVCLVPAANECTDHQGPPCSAVVSGISEGGDRHPRERCQKGVASMKTAIFSSLRVKSLA